MIRRRFLMFVLLVATAMNAAESVAQQAGQLSADDFEKGIGQTGIQLLDVRTTEEYQSGHLKDAFLADWTNKDQFIKSVQALDRTRPVYTYCLAGVRGEAASAWLSENGFTAYNLTGGIAAWKRAGKPVEEAVFVKQMNLQEYHALIPANRTVLVYVGAAWCPPCKKMNIVIDSLATSKGSSFHLVKIDGGEQTAICKQLKIVTFPTFIIYKVGKEAWRHSGIIDGKELAKVIN